jgi:metallo-beta-lactamase family protein
MAKIYGIMRRYRKYRVKEGDTVETWTIWALGGANRIGGSGLLNQLLGKNILIDCGNDVPDGLSADDLLWSPEVDLRKELAGKHIDLCIITHGHNDHVGALLKVWKDHPEMRVMMTRPTLETTRIALADGIRIGYKDKYGNIDENDKEAMREELNEMEDMLANVETIKSLKSEDKGFFIPFPNVPITIGCFPADHIRGAITVLIKAKKNGGEKSVLFTGDFGLENKETVLAAPIRDEYQNVDLVLVDSTNGSTPLPPREERLTRLKTVVLETLERRGNVLLPSFANERSPEVMISLIKEDIRVFMDGMGNKFLDLYRSPEGRWCYRDRMFHASEPVWRNFTRVEPRWQNPRGLTREKILRSRDPWVVVATSATLKGGPSAEYAMRIIEDPASTIIFPCHVFENTPAHTLLNQRGEPITLVTRLYPEGKPVIPQCQVEQVRLSAHMDQNAIVRFIEEIRPKQVAPVHCGGLNSHDAIEDRLRGKFRVIRTKNGRIVEAEL